MTIWIGADGLKEYHFDPESIDKAHSLFDDPAFRAVALVLRGTDAKGRPVTMTIARKPDLRVIQIGGLPSVTGDEAEAVLSGLAADAQREMARRPN